MSVTFYSLPVSIPYDLYSKMIEKERLFKEAKETDQDTSQHEKDLELIYKKVNYFLSTSPAYQEFIDFSIDNYQEAS